MDYLLEIHWSDPIADAVARILYSAPESVELMTGHVPQGWGRAFVVYRSDSFEILEGLARAMSNLGARVRVTSAANGTGKLHEGPGDGT